MRTVREDRCHKRGLDGKLDLALQWAHEQEAVGGEVNFKEGLAFYSSIGIIQVRRRIGSMASAVGGSDGERGLMMEVSAFIAR